MCERRHFSVVLRMLRDESVPVEMIQDYIGEHDLALAVEKLCYRRVISRIYRRHLQTCRHPFPWDREGSIERRFRRLEALWERLLDATHPLLPEGHQKMFGSLCGSCKKSWCMNMCCGD